MPNFSAFNENPKPTSKRTGGEILDMLQTCLDNEKDMTSKARDFHELFENRISELTAIDDGEKKKLKKIAKTLKGKIRPPSGNFETWCLGRAQHLAGKDDEVVEFEWFGHDDYITPFKTYVQEAYDSISKFQ